MERCSDSDAGEGAFHTRKRVCGKCRMHPPPGRGTGTDAASLHFMVQATAEAGSNPAPTPAQACNVFMATAN